MYNSHSNIDIDIDRYKLLRQLLLHWQPFRSYWLPPEDTFKQCVLTHFHLDRVQTLVEKRTFFSVTVMTREKSIRKVGSVDPGRRWESVHWLIVIILITRHITPQEGLIQSSDALSWRFVTSEIWGPTARNISAIRGLLNYVRQMRDGGKTPVRARLFSHLRVYVDCC